MPAIVEIVLLPQELDQPDVLLQKAARQAALKTTEIGHIEILKRSLDARGSQAVFRLRVEVYVKTELYVPEPALLEGLHPVPDAPKVIIVGAGPAGYFAALELLANGLCPVVLDRGKDVRTRRRDLRAIQQMGVVNPHSNYCFGEGGAGTYSDGKLYTRSVKRGNIYKSLKLLVEHGASSDILIDAHPHIGSNKLPEVVQNIRATIERYGGAVHFNRQVTDFVVKQGKIAGVRTTATPDALPGTPASEEWLGAAVIVATGHSARDIYQLLHQKGILVEAKPFALGVRVEHPQSMVDAIQYRQTPRLDYLPAASYSLVCQVAGKGVFSFCMCPGGLVVPAATAPGEIVVNGMSMSRRDSPFANSGIVTSIEADDLKPFSAHGVFAAMEFQAETERRMWQAGDGSQKAPGLRLPDFINRKQSASLPKSSYIPGLFPAPLFELLPAPVYARLRAGFQDFSKKMRGFYSEEAVVIGTESRTSAPVRIPRDPDTLHHVQITGLFPCGEGAGYAGGIISAAMDGQRVAVAIAKWLAETTGTV